MPLIKVDDVLYVSPEKFDFIEYDAKREAYWLSKICPDGKDTQVCDIPRDGRTIDDILRLLYLDDYLIVNDYFAIKKSIIDSAHAIVLDEGGFYLINENGTLVKYIDEVDIIRSYLTTF